MKTRNSSTDAKMKKQKLIQSKKKEGQRVA